MKKAERQIIINRYAEHAEAYGWYLDETNVSETNRICFRIEQGAMMAIRDIMRDLGIEPDQDYIAKGRERWQENHKQKEEGKTK